MKWFKHLTGALNDSLIFEAIEKFGSDGYLVFFGTLEIMSDEFNPFEPGSVRLSIKKLTQNFQLSRQKTLKILAFFDQKAKEEATKDKSFLVCFEKAHVVIKCNRLAKLCDEHTQKLLKKNRDSVPIESGFTPAIEVEIRNKNINKPPIVPRKRGMVYAQDFLTFWKHYPKKTGKDAAWKAWRNRNGDRPGVEALIQAIEIQKQSDQWTKDGGQYIPNPATWINQGRWNDELTQGAPHGTRQRLDKYGRPIPRQAWEDEAERITREWEQQKALEAAAGRETGKEP